MRCHCRLLAGALGLLLLAASAPAAAWNAAGHRLVATIAWKEMSPQARTAAGRLLAAHPDYERWREKAKGPDIDHAAFLEASTWPDDIKRDRRFHDDAAPPTPKLPGYPDMARHKRWHHADHRLDDGGRSGSGELDSRLPILIRTLGSRSSPLAERSYALPWLIHLVADAHQPLHVASRHDEDGDSDEGGNGLWVETPLHPRLREMSLHAYWDDLPGPPWLRGERLESAAEALLRSFAANRDTAVQRENVADIGRWIGESRELARTTAYAGLAGTSPVIDESYSDRARQTARLRITLAGKRLGRLLESLLGNGVPRETSRQGKSAP